MLVHPSPQFFVTMRQNQGNYTLPWQQVKILFLGESNGKVKFLLVTCARAKLPQSCLPLCDQMDCRLPGSSVLGIIQARILEWVAMPSSRGSSWPRDQTHIFTSPALAGGFFTTSNTWEALDSHNWVLILVTRGLAKQLHFEGVLSYF